MGGYSTASAHKQQSEIAKPRRSFDLNHQRRRDIARLVVVRHGKLARAALCIPYVVAAAWHCPSDSDRRFLMVQWCRWTCAPPSVEREIDAILKANPARRIRADTLAMQIPVHRSHSTLLAWLPIVELLRQPSKLSTFDLSNSRRSTNLPYLGHFRGSTSSSDSDEARTRRPSFGTIRCAAHPLLRPIRSR
jgi:hypothetical protein